MQPPDARHWKYQNCEIRDDVEDPGSLKCSVDAETMTGGHEWVPDLFARGTSCNSKDSHHEIEDQVAPDTRMSPDVDEQIAFPGWGENTKILKQDGEFDEEDHEAIDNS